MYLSITRWRYIVEIQEISKEEYDHYLNTVQITSFLQTSPMSSVLEVNDNETKFLALSNEGEILAVALVHIRGILGGVMIDLMTGAISAKPENEYIFYDKLKSYVKQKNCLKLVVKPNRTYCKLDQDGNLIGSVNYNCLENMKKIGYMANDGSVSPFEGEPDYQFVKSLNDFSPFNDTELLKSFNKNAQRKITKGKEIDLKVRALEKDELEEFKSLTLETSQRQGFRDLPLKYYQAFFESFSENAEFLTAEIDLNHSIQKLYDITEELNKSPKKNKQRVESLRKEIKNLEELKEHTDNNIIQLANMIIVYMKNQAIYFIGGSRTEYQKLPGAFMIQFEAMKRTIQRNIPLYNFFGVEGNFDGSDGVLRFKKNFNGYIIRNAGSFIYYPHPFKYNVIQTLKNIKNRIIG